MGCTLEELGERMSAEEFGLRLAFEEEEPQGSRALEIAVSQVRAALANGALKPRPGRTSFAPVDFYPSSRWQPQAPADQVREPTAQEIEARFGG